VGFGSQSQSRADPRKRYRICRHSSHLYYTTGPVAEPIPHLNCCALDLSSFPCHLSIAHFFKPTFCLGQIGKCVKGVLQAQSSSRGGKIRCKFLDGAKQEQGNSCIRSFPRRFSSDRTKELIVIQPPTFSLPRAESQ